MPQKGSAVFKNRTLKKYWKMDGHGTGKVREMVRETVWEPSTIWLILETVYTLTLARWPVATSSYRQTQLISNLLAWIGDLILVAKSVI